MRGPTVSAFALLLLALASRAASLEGAGFDPPPSWTFPNPRLRAAYVALQTWKRTAIFSDPTNFTANWVGPNVCGYKGVYCSPLPDDGHDFVVAGIDLNHADIAGYLPASLADGLPDLGLFHLNSNRFCGVVPDTFRRLRLLHELDLSNNRFVGVFPEVVLSLPSLRYLDLRFNDFEGSIPTGLFDRPLDAIFLNSNRLTKPIPANLGNSPASVVVLAHNKLGGCIPPSIGRMAETLNEIVLIDDELAGCVPLEVGLLRKVTVFDVSDNHLQGPLPGTVAGMAALEELDLARNLLQGPVPSGVCGLRSLKKFTYEDNFFTSRPGCTAATADGRWNCIPGAPAQRPPAQCAAAAAHPFDCSKAQCQAMPLRPPQTKGRRGGGRVPPSPKGSTPRGTFTRPPPPPSSSSSTPSYPSPVAALPPPTHSDKPGERFTPPPGSYSPKPSMPLPSTPSYGSPPLFPSPPLSSSYQPPSGQPMTSPPTQHPGYVLPPPSPTTPSYHPPSPTPSVPSPPQSGTGDQGHDHEHGLPFPPVHGVSYASPPPPTKRYN